MATVSQRLQFLISADPRDAVKGFENASKAADRELGKVDTRLDKLGTNMTKFGLGAMAFAGVAFAGLSKLVGGASDLNESINAVRVTYGDAADGIIRLSENAANAVGLPKREFNDLAVSFAAFAKQVAGDGGDVVETVDNMTTRVADFASVMNLDIAEAASIFQSALAGQSQPIRRFGIDLSAATVQQHALETGIIETNRAMTEAEKVQARYSLIMQATEHVAGDFANTSDSLANRQRILRANLTDLRDDIGTGLLPMFESLTGVAGSLVGAFNNLDSGTKAAIGTFAGYATALIGAAGALSFVGGQAIKQRDRFQRLFTTVDAEGVRSFSKMGKAATLGMGAAGVAVLGFAAHAAHGARQTALLQGAIDDLARASQDDLPRAAVQAFMRLMLDGADGAAGAMHRLADENLSAAIAIRDAAEADSEFAAVLAQKGVTLEVVQQAIDDAAAAQAQANERNEAAARLVEDLGEATEDLADETNEAKRAADAHRAAMERQEKIMRDAADAARDKLRSVNDMADAQRAAADSTFALRREEDRFRDAIDKVNEVLNDQDADLRDVRRALDDATLSAGSLADVEVRIARETATANGEVMTASEETDIWNRSMLEAAETADGPLRDSILEYIGTVNDIPDETVTDILALIDEGKVAEAEQLLMATSRTREAQIDAQANVARADADLDAVARKNRTAIINASLGVTSLSQGTGGRGPSRHVGGRVRPGEVYRTIPGEAFVPDVPGRVNSREDTKRMGTPAASGHIITVNVTNPRNEDDVRRAVQRALLMSELAS